MFTLGLLIPCHALKCAVAHLYGGDDYVISQGKHFELPIQILHAVDDHASSIVASGYPSVLHRHDLQLLQKAMGKVGAGSEQNAGEGGRSDAAAMVASALLPGVWANPLHLVLGSRAGHLGSGTFAPAHPAGVIHRRRLAECPLDAAWYRNDS